MYKIFCRSNVENFWQKSETERTAPGDCRSGDFAEVNDENIGLSAVKMSKAVGKSQKPKEPLWDNVDLLILLKSKINV